MTADASTDVVDRRPRAQLLARAGPGRRRSWGRAGAGGDDRCGGPASSPTAGCSALGLVSLRGAPAALGRRPFRMSTRGSWSLTEEGHSGLPACAVRDLRLRCTICSAVSTGNAVAGISARGRRSCPHRQSYRWSCSHPQAADARGEDPRPPDAARRAKLQRFCRPASPAHRSSTDAGLYSAAELLGAVGRRTGRRSQSRPTRLCGVSEPGVILSWFNLIPPPRDGSLIWTGAGCMMTRRLPGRRPGPSRLPTRISTEETSIRRDRLDLSLTVPPLIVKLADPTCA